MSHNVQNASPQERTVQAKRLVVLTLRNTMLKKDITQSESYEVSDERYQYTDFQSRCYSGDTALASTSTMRRDFDD